MNTDRIEGRAIHARGAVKNASGKLTVDTKRGAEGAAEKTTDEARDAATGREDPAQDVVTG